ncbi:leucine--tRNA ligase [Patescibacteria group bacterium AH-259-L07]|nr:leucine--tRNA ligase [Patescibacteria group bacterium AH-259-L07]
MAVGDKYNHQKIEQKWQKIWEELGLYKAQDFSKRPKSYILIEFPYLSGDGLHVGHGRSYSALDAIARKRRMQGYNVLYPIGWDAFGLPTENYAIKTGIHPIEITKKNVALFRRQLKSLGLSFDWSREINTSDPIYYKWTQWIFLKMFECGLAYLAEIPINWCPECKIGLANEEVIGGNCERCGKEVERRQQKQWMLKITAYADRLLKDLDGIDYLEKIKAQQVHWIGRSEGVTVKFKVKSFSPRLIRPGRKKSKVDEVVEVFTTRADTLFGVTALVLAPEHRLITDCLSLVENRKEVEEYIKQSKKKSEFERTELEKEKTGVLLKGMYVINPVNNEKVPIWIGDYVVATYGGGAVMVVPAHDKRDYAFAKKYGLEIREVVKGGDISKEAFVDYGILINSGKFSGLESKEAIKKIGKWLERHKKGEQEVQYKLRDWVFSRQHYWGEPIPLVFCENCAVKIKNQKSKIKNFSQGELLNPGWKAVPEEDLPLELPYVKSYKPTETGESPLAHISEWVNTTCPKCGSKAKRETDTMPNWAGSNWYFLRYIDPKNDKVLADYKKLKYWLPVDLYNGGMEHTTLHLLYSRFWHKFLYDIGVVPTSEPYKRRRSHGMVLAEDGRKMSKSFGNVINTDDIVNTFGADVFRVYEMFMGPFDQAIAWNPKTILGVDRFLAKVRNITLGVIPSSSTLSSRASGVPMKSEQASEGRDDNLEQLMHQTIKKVSEDLDNMKFNTAVAALMEYTNELITQYGKLKTEYIETLLLLLAPFVPHITEELWHRIHPKLSEKRSIFKEQWPGYNLRLAKSKEIELVIQINGKVRDKTRTNADILEKQAEKLALKQKKIQTYIKGKKIKKIIFIKGKLINLVID